jgi:uncharacterized protein
MRLLIDGYNLMFQSSSPDEKKHGRSALRVARAELLTRLIDLIPADLRERTLIVFDASNPPPNLPDRTVRAGIQIVFSRNWTSADELIQEEIRKHSTPKQLTVVSSDHAIHRKAKARGAKVFDSDVWLDQQIDRVEKEERLERDAIVNESASNDGSHRDDAEWKQRVLSQDEKDRWLRDFGF